jgi:hypothetical protein
VLEFVDNIEDDRHIMVPCVSTRDTTCGHAVHQECAIKLFQINGVRVETAYDDDIVELEFKYRCFCGLMASTFRSADVSLGNDCMHIYIKYFHISYIHSFNNFIYIDHRLCICPDLSTLPLFAPQPQFEYDFPPLVDDAGFPVDDAEVDTLNDWEEEDDDMIIDDYANATIHCAYCGK